ncbi:MAG: 30S ribosomal protein S2, partial [Patescibacteria group bacterium]
ELKEYFPKERSRLEKELNKMKMLYSGVVNLENLPDALFIVNLAYPSHLTAKREALKLKIPIIAIAGSDNDLTGVDYFIPANDKAPKSIAFLVDYLIQKLKT